MNRVRDGDSDATQGAAHLKAKIKANADANSNSNSTTDNTDGQNKAVGHVLLALGGVGVLIGFIALGSNAQLAFIDPLAMVFSGLMMMAVGTWQRGGW
ncbi:MAG: hypothetical protein H7Z43_02100 [Clostridia bacterium]|nr:hypothetical protein [Deltaproteobacteria bacterium]